MTDVELAGLIADRLNGGIKSSVYALLKGKYNVDLKNADDGTNFITLFIAKPGDCAAEEGVVLEFSMDLESNQDVLRDIQEYINNFDYLKDAR